MKKNNCLTEVFSRVTGFFRPVQSWNPGKGVNGEYADRKNFSIKRADTASKEDKEVPGNVS